MVGFLILNFNSWEQTIKLAQKVADFNLIDVVAVIDNCSTDDSLNRLQKLNHKKIFVHETGHNGGYSFGNNIGMKLLADKGADMVFLSNPDVDIEENSLNIIIDEFENGYYSVLSCVEHDSEDKISEPIYWEMPSYLDDLRSCFLLGRIKQHKNHINSIDWNKHVIEAPVIKGSFMAFKTDDFFEVGGFDDSIFLYCEERLIAKRMQNKNNHIGIVLNAKYNHNHTASIEKAYSGSVKKIRILYKSRMYYNIEYNRIGLFKKCLLAIAMKYSIGEYWLIDALRKLGVGRNV